MNNHINVLLKKLISIIDVNCCKSCSSGIKDQVNVYFEQCMISLDTDRADCLLSIDCIKPRDNVLPWLSIQCPNSMLQFTSTKILSERVENEIISSSTESSYSSEDFVDPARYFSLLNISKCPDYIAKKKGLAASRPPLSTIKE